MTGHVLFVVYPTTAGYGSSKLENHIDFSYIHIQYATPNALVSYQEKFNIPKAVGHPVAL